MSARRVGFGGADEAADGHGPKGGDEKPDAPDAKEMSPVGKLILALFLIAWLVGWGVGLYEMSGVVPNAFARGDWFSLGFGVVWLIFGGLGWAFALVMLVAVLFGRKQDPNNRSPLRKRMAERRELREARRRLRRRD